MGRQLPNRTTLLGALLLASPPAFAHGGDAVLGLLSVIATAFGVVAGAIGAARRSRRVDGVSIAIFLYAATLFIVVLALSLFSAGSTSSVLDDLQLALLAGVIAFLLAPILVLGYVLSEWLVCRLVLRDRSSKPGNGA
jgi:hypothetical protein